MKRKLISTVSVVALSLSVLSLNNVYANEDSSELNGTKVVETGGLILNLETTNVNETVNLTDFYNKNTTGKYVGKGFDDEYNIVDVFKGPELLKIDRISITNLTGIPASSNVMVSVSELIEKEPDSGFAESTEAKVIPIEHTTLIENTEDSNGDFITTSYKNLEDNGIPTDNSIFELYNWLNYDTTRDWYWSINLTSLPSNSGLLDMVNYPTGITPYEMTATFTVIVDDIVE